MKKKDIGIVRIFIYGNLIIHGRSSNICGAILYI